MEIKRLLEHGGSKIHFGPSGLTPSNDYAFNGNIIPAKKQLIFPSLSSRSTQIKVLVTLL